MKPTYHFLPPTDSWLNDPNGLIFWRGQFHLFYQWNPTAPQWGNIHWGHAVSADLVNWTHLPPALIPSDDYDSSGCWSGCAVEHDGKLCLIYTASRNYNPATDHADIQIRLATSEDGVAFIKHPKPLIEWDWGTEVGGKKLCGFRDPVVWREGAVWKMSVGAGIEGQGGTTVLYQSLDLLEWTFIGFLAVGDLFSQTPIWTGSVWECSQLVTFAQASVLLMSVWHKRWGEYTAYLWGNYADDQLEIIGGTKLDWGNSFYAPQAFQDPQGNWIMFGWLTEKRSGEAQQQAGWSGCMSVPRILTMGKGELLQHPAPQLEQLRGRYWKMAGTIEGRKPLGFIVSALELQLEAHTSQTLEIILHQSADGSELAKLVYDPKQGMLWLEGSLTTEPRPQMPLKPSEDLELCIFTDCTTIEVFSQGQALSTRIYPNEPNLGVSLDGWAKVERLEVWELEKP